jgi:ribosomal protein S18 acetylase RimI-like enzyme
MRERIVGNASLLFGQSDYDRHKASFGITVHEDYQNVGLGSYLTGFMIRVSRAKGLKKIVLEVVSHIERVIKVYERNGFKKEGLLVKNHWNYILERYCDDFVMGLLL